MDTYIDCCTYLGAYLGSFSALEQVDVSCIGYTIHAVYRVSDVVSKHAHVVTGIQSDTHFLCVSCIADTFRYIKVDVSTPLWRIGPCPQSYVSLLRVGTDTRRNVQNGEAQNFVQMDVQTVARPEPDRPAGRSGPGPPGSGGRAGGSKDR